MSTIRAIPSDPPLSDPSLSPTRSQDSTATTVATLTPNGRHRAAASTTPATRPSIPLHPYAYRRPPNPNTLTSLNSIDGVYEMEMDGPQSWPEVKRTWWKRLWSWLRGWGFR
ncbi:hypothetical protein QM012_002935 [Aureobasidium pullulans]|uniref:Uncharacterized protein n=1 Tax=Aureobasidium pullulans TaxID=5580 RepID=A0ABR0TB21_AURPU